MNSRLAFLLKTVSTKDRFSAVLQSGLTSTLVLVKVRDVHCRAARCYTINFLKNVLLGKLVFKTISENNLQSVYCRLAT